MEYFRQENNRIQAGFASNAGKLLRQYSAFCERFMPEEQYDATLTICVIQSLLTNCSQLIKEMREHQKGIWLELVHEVPASFGISHSFVKKNTFSLEPSKFTYGDFIEHLRNALSHPTYPEKPPNLPSTGYTTTNDVGIISHFRFIDSPWVSRGRNLSMACTNDEIKLHTTIRDFSKTHNNCGALEVRRNSNGKYQIYRENEVYLPVFEAELPLWCLKILATELANHLAQPTQEDWDSKSIAPVVT